MNAELIYKSSDYYDITNTGWLIVEELQECFVVGEPIFKGTQNYWIMYREENNWYPHGVFRTMQKAMKRLELIINGEIEC